jgi:replicative DNA helicase
MNALARIDDAVLHNIALEQEALGTVLVHNSALEIIEREVSAADFFEPLHSEIFEAFGRSRDAHGTITPALIIASIGGDASQIIIGMTRGQYIARLAAVGCTLPQAQAYAKQIREFSNRRRLLVVAETITSAIGANQPAADIAGAGIELLDDIAAQAAAGSTRQVSLREANDKSLTRMQWAMQNPGKLAGISWGLTRLDEKTGGLKRGELIIMAGRPGMGKTALALCVARSTAIAGEPTYFQSLEMGDVSLSDRNLADAVFEFGRPVPYYDIANGSLTDTRAQRVINAARLQRDLPLRIDPAPGLTVSQIAARARRYKQILERQGLRLGPVIVDHMHIVSPSNRYSGARVNEVGEISGALKGLAKELDVPVIALAQLSRKVEEREDKRPNMADLRDSGSIEQDADIIIFVFREAYYLERVRFDNQQREMGRVDRLVDVKDQLEVIVAKQRNGPTGTVSLFCNIACNAIRDLEAF